MPPLPRSRSRLAALAVAVVGGCASSGASRPDPAPVAPPAAVAPAPPSAAALATVPDSSAPNAPTPTGAAPGSPPASAALPLANDSVAFALLTDVRAADSTVLVDLRYATPYNFTGAVLPGYAAPHALLRREAATALAVVQRALAADGLGLKVYDAYRPVRATEAMVAWAHRVHRDDLLRDGYIAEQSRHNLGLAVDLTLVDRVTGRELKMGTAFDTFSPAAHTANATGEVAANRARLTRAMSAAGFHNLAEEWWHFSYDVPAPLRFDLVIR